jgi:hypothetical protein
LAGRFDDRDRAAAACGFFLAAPGFLAVPGLRAAVVRVDLAAVVFGFAVVATLLFRAAVLPAAVFAAFVFRALVVTALALAGAFRRRGASAIAAALVFASSKVTS